MIIFLLWIYVSLFTIAIIALSVAYQRIYGTEISKIFNYSSEYLHQPWSRPRNIKDLWNMEMQGKLNDPLTRKWIRIFIYSKRATIVLAIPFVVFTILLVIVTIIH